MRNIEEIQQDIRSATTAKDADALMLLAVELDGRSTPLAEASSQNARGQSLFIRNDHASARAHFEQALMLFEQLNDRLGSANALYNIGNTYKSTGDHPAGLETYQRALALYEEIGHNSGIASTSSNIGIMHMNTGDYPAALEYFHHALALYEQQEDRSGVAGATCNIGIVYTSTGDYPTALEHYDRALALCEEIGNRTFAANITANIGSAYVALEDHAAALTYFHRALALYEELADGRGMASTFSNLGIVHSNNNDHSSAIESFHRALVLCDELNLPHTTANVSSNLVAVYASMGSDDEAWAYLRTMESMHIDDPGVLISNDLNRAVLLLRNGNSDEALASTLNALAKAKEHGIRSREARAHNALRELAQVRNDFAAYIEHNNEFIRITEEINGRDTATKLAMQAKQREIDAERKETEKQLAVLHSTLPKAIAERVARGEVVNDHYENAAVIFLDIVGFTEISSAMSSQEVITLLDDVFTQCDAICAKHGVTKIKTIGDSYMCVSFDNVINAARCALDMSRISISHAVSHNVSHTVSHEVLFRIGMHCGPVTAGVIGKERMQYDVWGDTVNVASRMESSGEAGRIHISEAFASDLKRNTEYTIQNPITESENQESHEVQLVTRHLSLVTQLRGSIDIKGKGPMQTYWLENA